MGVPATDTGTVGTVGGAVLGQGVHGRTFDAGRTADARDGATLHAELLAPGPQAPGRSWRLTFADGREVDCDAGPDRQALLSAVRGAHAFVAKTFLGARNRTAEESFGLELEMRARVLEAYGSAAAAREFTTVTSGLPLGSKKSKRSKSKPSHELVAIRVHGGGPPDAFYLLSSKCDVPLDRKAFGSPGELLEMALDMLDSFAMLHAGGVLHADVKLDNMVFCSSGPGRRFKLIDWGGSLGVRELRARYMASGEPKNTASPMAWYAWGLGPRLTIKAFMLLHAKMLGAAFVSSLELIRFCASSLESFTHAVERLESAAPTAGGGRRARRAEASLSGLLPAQRAVRRAILERHTPSFDLYNLGLALAKLAVTTPAGGDDATRQRVMRLARALTHYGDDDFVGDDAALAAQRLRAGDL